MATIIELKPRPKTQPNDIDVSGKVSEMMYVFDVLDQAVLSTSHYKFASCWKRSVRSWTIDGLEVDREDFELHLAAWLRTRIVPRVERTYATVLPMSEFRYLAR